eukprot:3903536-Amphidinium_carterae.1
MFICASSASGLLAFRVGTVLFSLDVLQLQISHPGCSRTLLRQSLRDFRPATSAHGPFQQQMVGNEILQFGGCMYCAQVLAQWDKANPKAPHTR